MLRIIWAHFTSRVRRISRAWAAPMQRCGPNPKLRCGFGFRSRRTSSGSAKTDSSRFAEAQQKVLQTQEQLQQIIDKAQRELVEIQNRVERSLPKSGGAQPSEPSLGRDSLVSRVAGNRVILVNELRPPLAPEVAATLRNYARRLERLGVMVVGEAPWREAEVDEIELVASLRNACGQTPTDTAEFGEHLRGWLEERDPASEAWAILWVSAAADGKTQVRLIGPLDEQGNPDAELRNTLLQRLSNDAAPATAPSKKKAKSSKRSGTPV